MKTYLVTGGAGFIGSNYIHYMFKKYGNEIRIINVDALTYAGNLENLKDIENRVNYSFVKANICDKSAIEKIFEENDRILNWKKIELPETPKARKYYKSKEDTLKIVETLSNYPHPIARGIFKFVLTGRRINEVLTLSHETLDYKNMKFKILAKYAKTNKDFEFPLTPTLIKAIKEQKTTSGRIFKLKYGTTLQHFKSAMSKIGIYDMVIHDIRSMVAQTALDNGANIYDVSKMLAHQKVSTTEGSYIEGGLAQAKKAQDIFERVITSSHEEQIEDAEIIEDKFSVIKNLYPNANDEIIKYAISILEGNLIK